MALPLAYSSAHRATVSQFGGEASDDFARRARSAKLVFQADLASSPAESLTTVKLNTVARENHTQILVRLAQILLSLWAKDDGRGEEERFYAGKFYLAEAEVWLESVELGIDARRPQP